MTINSQAWTCGPGSQPIFTGLYNSPWSFYLAKDIPLYALLMLVPLNSLFSIVFWGLVHEALIAAAYSLGYYTSYVGVGSCSCGSNTPNVSPPLNFSSLITGSILGVFVMTAYLERQHIMRTLKMAFGGLKDEAYEAKEPMSYKTAWVMTIVSYVLMMALFMSAGMSIWVSFIVTLTGVVTWFSMSQLWGRVGLSNEPG